MMRGGRVPGIWRCGRRIAGAFPLALVALLWAGQPPGAVPAAEPAVVESDRAPQPLEAPGMHNVFRLSPRLLSGSSPESDEAFAALARLGVKTIVSVDGARPNVEGARRHGLRYVHLPHGYDGLGSEVQERLIRVARTLPGPVFVHCHHGKHRGPAAAAVICLGTEGWTVDRAEAYLRLAGTATHYTGLYEAVRRFRPPSPAGVGSAPGDLPEVAAVPGLVEAMVGIDQRWEILRAVRAAGYRVPGEHPDVHPAHEALMVREHYREAGRLPESARRGGGFVDRLAEAEAEAKALEDLLQANPEPTAPEVRARLEAAFEAVGRSCTRCHREFRDGAPRPEGR